MNELMQYSAFLVDFLALMIMLLRFIHIVALTSVNFLRPSRAQFYGCTCLIPVDGRLDYFLVWVIMNNVFINICAEIYVKVSIFISLRQIFTKTSCNHTIVSFRRKCQTVFQSDCIYFRFPPSKRVSVAPHLFQQVIVPRFFSPC